MKFILNHDIVTICDKKEVINSGSVNYYEAEVEFDRSWNNLNIKAVLIKDGEEEGIQTAVINNKFFIDKELSGCYRIGFVGYTIENETKVYQISTNLVSFYVEQGAGSIEAIEGDIPTPTEWEIYLAKIEEIINGVNNEITNKVLTTIQPILEKNLQDMKDYTDEEIATFDFIKVVDILPETGLINRIYFVPKTDKETQDLFDEYIWTNNNWEFLGTKKIEIDLTACLKREEVNEKDLLITYEDEATETLKLVVYK